MSVIYSNNATTTLTAGINSSVTSLDVASVSKFPTIAGSDYYFATLANTNNTKIEVVKVTAASTTTLTVVRAQDGTAAQTFDSGDNFQIRVTTATLEAATQTDVSISGGVIDGALITDGTISAAELNVTGNGTSGQYLGSDADGSMTWSTPTDTDTVYTHPNHSGDVVSTADGLTVIQVDAVDIPMLSATGTASSTTFLRGDNTWVTPTDTDTVYTHPNHSGDITSTADGDTVIAAGAVDIAMLSATGTAGSTNFLRGDNTWVVPTDTNDNTTYTASTGLTLTGTAFSVQADLRDGITHVGRDANDYIHIDVAHVRFYINGVNVMSVDASGNAIFKGTVSSNGTPA